LSVWTGTLVHKGYGASFEGRGRPSEGSQRLSRPPAIDAVVRILECPQCHGTDLYYEAGLITGYKYHCKACNYVGAFVIEREIEIPKEPEKSEK